MLKKVKLLLLISLVLNLLFLAVGSAAVYKRGGLSYLINKAKTVMGKQEYPPYYLDRVSLFEELPSKKNAVVFLGDSITDWTEWQELFPDANIINRGIAGDTTQGVLARMENIFKTKPSKLFLMVGTNDLEAEINIPSITANYQQIVQIIRQESPDTKIYIQSVLPIDNTFQSKRNNNDVIALNSNLQLIADKSQATYIDLYTLFISNNRLNPQYTHDGLHLNGKGYLVWKKEIEQYLQ